jgi:Fic family protein
MTGDRHSQAEAVELITDPDEKARREAENGVRQFKTALEVIREFVQDSERPFRLRQAHILELHRQALQGIHALAGTYRNTPVKIGKSRHVRPAAFQVADHVAELCEYVNENWEAKSAIHLSAYMLWRLNWIHPFADGNGRTSRAVSYVVLSIKLNSILPGTPTIPEQIAADKAPYYDALEAADEAWESGRIDLRTMEEMLEGMLATQLLNATQEAAGA